MNVDPQTVITKLAERMTQATIQSVVQEAVIDDLRGQLMQAQGQVAQVELENRALRDQVTMLTPAPEEAEEAKPTIGTVKATTKVKTG
jgi:uncharacterized coiled-coil protein SlyX